VIVLSEFSKLCPVWNARIHSENEIPKDEKRKLWTDVKRPSRCVVAEAYGFSDDYATSDDFLIPKKYKRCHMCREFATRFSNIVSPLFYVREDHVWKRKLFEEYKDKNKEVVIKFEEIDENVNVSNITALELEFVEHIKSKH
jgi:hypothetical protein